MSVKAHLVLDLDEDLRTFNIECSGSKPLRIAIETCELQIPKQPISKSWSPNLCPHCDADLGGDCNDGYYQNPHYERCPVCGQKLKYI